MLPNGQEWKVVLAVFPDGATAWLGDIQFEPPQLRIEFESKRPGEGPAFAELSRLTANMLEQMAHTLRRNAREFETAKALLDETNVVNDGQ